MSVLRWASAGVLLALLVLPSASADHLGCHWTTTWTLYEARGFYIANDWCQPDCAFSVWVYQESNGIPGLQRADQVRDDTCGGEIESDALFMDLWHPFQVIGYGLGSLLSGIIQTIQNLDVNT